MGPLEDGADSGAGLDVDVDVVAMVLGGATSVLHRAPALAGAAGRPDLLVPDDVVDPELAGVLLGVVGERLPLGATGGAEGHHEVGREAGRVSVGVGGAVAVAADG